MFWTKVPLYFEIMPQISNMSYFEFVHGQYLLSRKLNLATSFDMSYTMLIVELISAENSLFIR